MRDDNGRFVKGHKPHINLLKKITGVPRSDQTKLKLSLAQKGKVISLETRQKIIANAKTNPNFGMKGKKHSEITKQKFIGKHPTKETREKISLSNIGKHFSPKTGFKIGNKINLGRKHTPEELLKMKECKIGKHLSPQTEFKKGQIPRNKGTKGLCSEETIMKMKNNRAKQILPTKDTLIELKIQGFLQQLKIECIKHKYIGEILHGYQCDIFIPSMNLIIECDGDYWHGNKNNPRYKILNEFQIKKQRIDNLRTKELLERGFKVIRLWESDINNITLSQFND